MDKKIASRYLTGVLNRPVTSSDIKQIIPVAISGASTVDSSSLTRTDDNIYYFGHLVVSADNSNPIRLFDGEDNLIINRTIINSNPLIFENCFFNYIDNNSSAVEFRVMFVGYRVDLIESVVKSSFTNDNYAPNPTS